MNKEENQRFPDLVVSPVFVVTGAMARRSEKKKYLDHDLPNPFWS